MKAHADRTISFCFRIACFVGLISIGLAHSAYASSTFPPVLAAAISAKYPSAVKCTPSCTACHLTTQGGPGNLNVFAVSLANLGGLQQQLTETVAPALDQLAMIDPDSDGDGVHDIEELIVGDSPSIAGDSGKNQFCPEAKDGNGCGAHVAAAPPPAVDRLGLFSAALVVAGLVVMRRRRAALRARRINK